MKTSRLLHPAVAPGLCLLLGLAGPARAHLDGHARVPEPAPAGEIQTDPASQTHPPQATWFAKFAPRVSVAWDEKHLYVQHNGLPGHDLMIDITAWQQQVPLPQPYEGENRWMIPLHPVPAKNPVSIKDRFLRGAIAIGVNGVPIFNPQNNRGEISREIGELDHWGGHCGRANDYHYHAAPLYLEKVVGPGNPIAYALDGYPILGTTEADGSTPAGLDAFNGHETPGSGYHYHASEKYPYVNGGFHGEVAELDGQVDPQPRARSVRPAQPPLRGATITGFTRSPDDKSFSLKYTVGARSGGVDYTRLGEDRWKFVFTSPDGTTREETYSADTRRNPAPEQRRPRDEQTPAPRARAAGAKAASAANETPPRSGRFHLSSPAIGADGVLPVDFTGDGAGPSPPLAWEGAPDGTRAYALIMHHVAGDGETKWYWTLYNLPAAVHALPKGATGAGTAGNNSVNRRLGYAPPHSKGPGAKTYVLTVYALSAPLEISGPPESVDRAALLATMQGRVLDSAELSVTYDRTHALENDRRPTP